MDMICRFFILLFTIFICLASVVVGFGSFAVLGCQLKSFDEVIQTCNAVLERSSANQIQAFNLNVYS